MIQHLFNRRIISVKTFLKYSADFVIFIAWLTDFWVYREWCDWAVFHTFNSTIIWDRWIYNFYSWGVGQFLCGEQPTSKTACLTAGTFLTLRQLWREKKLGWQVLGAKPLSCSSLTASRAKSVWISLKSRISCFFFKRGIRDDINLLSRLCRATLTYKIWFRRKTFLMNPTHSLGRERREISQ